MIENEEANELDRRRYQKRCRDQVFNQAENGVNKYEKGAGENLLPTQNRIK